MSRGEQSITAVTLASRTPDHENEAHRNTKHEENGACDVSAPTFYGNHLVQRNRLRPTPGGTVITHNAVGFYSRVVDGFVLSTGQKDPDPSVVSDLIEFDMLVGRAGGHPDEQPDQDKRDGTATEHGSLLRKRLKHEVEPLHVGAIVNVLDVLANPAVLLRS